MQDARTPLCAAALKALAYILLAVPLSRQLGHSGIALANSLAFSGEALFLPYLLNRKLPGILRVETTLLRVVGVSAAGMVLVYGLMRLPLPTFPVTLAALVVGGFAVLPFIWSEVKLLIKL